MKTPLSHVDEIVGSPSKIGILRVLSSGKGFKATGREIARRAGFSVPATHESLKDLHSRNVLTLDIIGKQHIYALNEQDRIVQKLIRPIFEMEIGFKEEIGIFIKEQMRMAGVQKYVASALLYGSLQKDTAVQGSDVDVAVVVSKAADLEKVSDAFESRVAPFFKTYFGTQLDLYIKSASEFRESLKKKRPPLGDLIKSYTVLYGKEPLEI